ncbi:DUF6378 domain-containing protein [Saccharopolyspora hattusasensis]|uniref:DUF6378 domain-containing protein n=1 Tax=Saccharopolyspora hattusasensis TaxID=1128679 RepID=UPI003D979FDF
MATEIRIDRDGDTWFQHPCGFFFRVKPSGDTCHCGNGEHPGGAGYLLRDLKREWGPLRNPNGTDRREADEDAAAPASPAGTPVPDDYLGVRIPDTLRPNWNDNRVEVGWWVRGVRSAVDQSKPAADTPRARVLAEASKLIHGDRNDTYGPPAANFERIAAMWSVLLGPQLSAPIQPRQVADMMIALKLTRSVVAPKRDNYVDIAGYAACGQEIAEGEK